MSLRRPGMASPALAALASCSLFRMRVSTPSVAVEDIVYRVSCASLCDEASENKSGDKKKQGFLN